MLTMPNSLPHEQKPLVANDCPPESSELTKIKFHHDQAMASLSAFKLTFVYGEMKNGVAEWKTELYRRQFDEYDRQ
jgi:hypothetical protein